ncbi:MAG TPA: fused MFS/spermidine synthase [Opitutales bacterium]|nr:fused MFS/spermidine synthase [Opitutales bacterium]
MKQERKRSIDKPAAGSAAADTGPGTQETTGTPPAYFLLVLLSGFAALIYQILWMRQLGLIFGNTAHAAAMTLGIFFLGLALGSAFWGLRSPRLSRPLRSFAKLELGIGLCGLLCLPLLYVYRSLYPTMGGAFGEGGLWMTRALLACLMILPGSFLMGGTIPLMGKFLVRRQLAFGRVTASIYAINTLGAASGAFAAAFIMLPNLGFRLSCLTAVGISLSVAALAVLLAKKGSLPQVAESIIEETAAAAEGPAIPRYAIGLLAFVSGFSVLALEVLWTRMFALVHENSVYSFAAILVIVLLALAGGAGLASRLARRSTGPVPMLHLLCLFNGLAVCVVPPIFMRLTDGLRMLPEQESFALYVFQLFATALLTIGLPCLLLGVLFPFLMKAEERFTHLPGKSIGLLTGVNTAGAILGSLICGFVLLEWLGMWRSMQMLAALYLLLAIILPAAGHWIGQSAKLASGIALLVLFNAWNPGELPIAGFDPKEGPQEVVERWEASDSTVTVVRKENGEHAIRINTNYSLGSSEAYMTQIFQTRVPLLAFPGTKSVFYLGMGTGITAGEALDRRDFPQIEKVTVCELSPKVITAAKKYFGGSPGRPDLVNGLFQDPRATVLARDGRNYLLTTQERYDMINADLFLPYRSGTGSLYSLEHYRTARERLNPGGVFVQWLPLYQLTEYEFAVITRTMQEVFPHLSLWRNHFQPGNEVVALIGHADNATLPPSSADSAQAQLRAVEGARAIDLPRVVLPVDEQTILLFYGGNLNGAGDKFADYPLNTDDRPVIEFGSPRTLRQAEEGVRPHFVGAQFADFVDRILAATPPDSDPLLAGRSAANRQLPLAGAAFHRAWIAFANQDIEALRRHWSLFMEHWLASADPSSAQ